MVRYGNTHVASKKILKNTIGKFKSGSEATPANVEAIVQRGLALWKSVYEPHADKLYDKLGSYHPDFICASSPTTLLICLYTTYGMSVPIVRIILCRFLLRVRSKFATLVLLV